MDEASLLSFPCPWDPVAFDASCNAMLRLDNLASRSQLMVFGALSSPSEPGMEPGCDLQAVMHCIMEQRDRLQVAHRELMPFFTVR